MSWGWRSGVRSTTVLLVFLGFALFLLSFGVSWVCFARFLSKTMISSIVEAIITPRSFYLTSPVPHCIESRRS